MTIYSSKPPPSIQQFFPYGQCKNSKISIFFKLKLYIMGNIVFYRIFRRYFVSPIKTAKTMEIDEKLIILSPILIIVPIACPFCGKEFGTVKSVLSHFKGCLNHSRWRSSHSETQYIVFMHTGARKKALCPNFSATKQIRPIPYKYRKKRVLVPAPGAPIVEPKVKNPVGRPRKKRPVGRPRGSTKKKRGCVS